MIPPLLVAQAALPLAVVAALGALARWWARPDDALPSTARWAAESLAIGAAVATLATALLPDLFPAVPFLAPDFDQYCAAVAQVRLGELDGVPPQRGAPGALLPALLARPLGILDGLWMAALLHRVALLAGLAAWARAAGGGRLGAASAALAAVALQPLWTLGDTLAFYPQWVSAAVGCAATASWAVRRPGVGTVALAGVVAALSLLLDPRGVLPALPALALAAGVALRLPGARATLAGLLALAVPLTFSYGAAHALVPRGAPGIEQQGLRYLEEAVRRRDAGAPPSLQPAIDRAQYREFLWGHRATVALPGSVARLATERRRVAAHLQAIGRADDPGAGAGEQLGPLLPLGALGGAVWLVVALRRRDPAGALALVHVAPMALSLHTAATIVGGARYFATGAPALALGAGLLVAAGVGRRRAEAGPPRRAAAALALLPAGVLLACVVGVVPSPWHPLAEWRAELWGDEEPAATLRQAWGDAPTAPRRVHPACLAGLQADRAAGLPEGSRLAGWLAPAPERAP